MEILRLEDYQLTDKGTQIDNGYLEYELYGCTNAGLIFERDNDRILYHISNGVKLISEYSPEGVFFRADKIDFFRHYKNEKDYKYSDTSIKLTENQIINIIKEYIYLHSPNLSSRTLLGWNKDKSGVLGNPNYCTSQVILDDFKEYTIVKRFDTVKVYEGINTNKFDYNDDTKKYFTSFKLKENLYDSALELQYIKRKIYTTLYGVLDINLFYKYINIKEDIEHGLKIK